MKLHKKLFSLVVVAAMVLGTVTTAFAATNTAEKVRQALEAAGVPADQTGKVVEYLQKVNITEAQANAVIAKIDGVKAEIGDTTDLTKVSSAVRDDIKDAVTSAAASLGLTADFSQKGSDGQTVVTLVDKDGKSLVTADVNTASEAVKSFDVEAIKDAVELAQDFSNNPDKGKYKFDPVTGVMKQTATNYGNMMVFGSALVLAGLGAFVYSKRSIHA